MAQGTTYTKIEASDVNTGIFYLSGTALRCRATRGGRGGGVGIGVEGGFGGGGWSGSVVGGVGGSGGWLRTRLPRHTLRIICWIYQQRISSHAEVNPQSFMKVQP